MISFPYKECYFSIVDLQYQINTTMSFPQRLKTIQNLIAQDTERCLQLLSSKSFINNLFYPQLVTLTNMFESLLTSKSTSSKHNNQPKNIIKPQIILAFYSIIILRSNSINIKKQVSTNIATKINQNSDSVYNQKLAIENLTKIYRTAEEGDSTRGIICGLLLKIKAFNNYKMVIKDITPSFISKQTMNQHFQAMKSQCPNLLEGQLNKFKNEWGEYLRFKTLGLAQFKALLHKLIEKQSSVEELNQHLEELNHEVTYILKRFSLISQNNECESINLDEILNQFEQIFSILSQRIKQTAIVLTKTSRGTQMSLEYDSNQFIHRNYLAILHSLLRILNQMITSIGSNWFRKIKWLYTFILNHFINFNIKGQNFHESIAKEYSKIFIINIQILNNYLITFKNGLFPQGKLTQLTFSQEYSIYKLVEAILYNQYPFEETQAIQYQNYQKQRKHHDNKNKQYLIDTVNFNMKSLNLNIHWDTLLIKIIPSLKNGVKFGKDIVYQSLLFVLKYFETTNNFQQASKLLLMLNNAKNTVFITDKSINSLIKRIKNTVYPDKEDLKQGIEQFCEEYFSQFKYHSKRKQEQEEIRRKKIPHLDLYQTDSLQFKSVGQINYQKIKKTQSYDSMLQGWEHFESVKDTIKDKSISEPKQGQIKSQNMFQSVDSEPNQIFYSINQSKHEKMIGSIKEDKEKIEKDQEKIEEEEILMPSF